MPPQPPQTGLQFLITLGVLVLMLAFRVGKEMGKPTKLLRLQELWITPAIFLSGVVAGLLAQPPKGLDWLWLLLALAVGATVGWQQGQTIEVLVNPATHNLNAKASSTPVTLLIVLVGIRAVLRPFGVAYGPAWYGPVSLATGMALVSGLGLLSARRIAMYRQATHALAEARSAAPVSYPQAQPAGPETPAPANNSNLKLLLLAGAVFLVVVIAGLALSR